MTRDEAMHIVRNPWGYPGAKVREARLLVCDLLEAAERKVTDLEGRLEAAEKRFIDVRRELDTEMENHRKTFKRLSKEKILCQSEVLYKLADDMEWCDYRPSSTSIRNKADELRRQAEEEQR